MDKPQEHQLQVSQNQSVAQAFVKVLLNTESLQILAFEVLTDDRANHHNCSAMVKCAMVKSNGTLQKPRSILGPQSTL